MKKYLIFCKSCIDKPENKYRHVWAGKLMWENEMSDQSGWHCSKCRKEFEVNEKIFIFKSETKEKSLD